MTTDTTTYIGAHTVTDTIPLTARIKLALSSGLVNLQNGLLGFFRTLLYKSNKAPERILIFRTGSLGDSLCAIPAIKAIAQAYPTAKIDILTNAGRASLVGLHHLVEKEVYNELIDYLGHSKKELFTLLKGRRYNMVVQLPQVDATFISLLRDLFFFRAIAPAGFGWRKSQTKWFKKTQAEFLQFPNEIQRLNNLLQRHHIAPFVADTIIKPSAQDISVAQQVLTELGVTSFQSLVAIVVGAKRPQNRWPIAYFKQVVDRLSAKHSVLLIGANDDNELVKPLLGIKNVFNTCGKLTPVQSAAAISFCRLTISNDTGPMHLSYAVGTPTIALFSSRDLPGKWYPNGKSSRVFRATNIHCQACYSETCTNNICMQAIAPAAVIQCAEELLN